MLLTKRVNVVGDNRNVAVEKCILVEFALKFLRRMQHFWLISPCRF